MVTVVAGGMAGSCGKGKVCGRMALSNEYEMAACSFGPNTGHTFVKDGKKYITRQMPISVINPNMDLVIGPAAVIDVDVFMKEAFKFRDAFVNYDRKIYIDSTTPIVTRHFIDWERGNLNHGSTFTGTGVARACRILRKSYSFKDWWQKSYLGYTASPLRDSMIFCNTADLLNDKLEQNMNILIEGSQGFELDTYNSSDYPYVSSKMFTIDGLCAELGVSTQYILDGILMLRPYPIRISNETDIKDEESGKYREFNSGHFGGGAEITWLDVADRCGAEHVSLVEERTTVTDRVRRVFEIDSSVLKRSLRINKPTRVYLNFVQHIDYKMLHQKEGCCVTTKVKKWVKDFELKYGYIIDYLGTGEEYDDMITMY